MDVLAARVVVVVRTGVAEVVTVSTCSAAAGARWLELLETKGPRPKPGLRPLALYQAVGLGLGKLLPVFLCRRSSAPSRRACLVFVFGKKFWVVDRDR